MPYPLIPPLNFILSLEIIAVSATVTSLKAPKVISVPTAMIAAASPMVASIFFQVIKFITDIDLLPAALGIHAIAISTVLLGLAYGNSNESRIRIANLLLLICGICVLGLGMDQVVLSAAR